MSWLRNLQNFGRGLIADLDTLSERASEAIEAHVLPTVANAARRLDNELDTVRAPKSDGLSVRVQRAARGLDDRYQEFMVTRVDPLFGQTRTQHLQEVGNLEISPRERMLNRQIAISGAALLVLAIGRAFFPATLFITVPASFLIVVPVFGMAVKSVKKQRRVTFHVLSAINITGVWLRRLYIPALLAMMVVYTGEKLLMVTEDRSHKGLIAIFAEQPRSVTALIDGVELSRPLDELRIGDTVVVFAGGYMPVDGTVCDGLATVDQHMLTGEAQPAEKSAGDQVYASTVVLSGKLYIRVDKAGSETVAAKIGDVLNQTASYQLALQSKGSKLAHDYALPTLLTGGLALGTVGVEGALATLNSGFGAGMRMSGPVLMLNLLNIASHHAILLKDGRSLEVLPEIDMVVFDKTGTLTLAQPNVADLHCVDGIDEHTLLAIAAAAEHQQTHPIARAIVAEAEARDLRPPTIDHASYQVGYGIKVKLGEQDIRVGSARFMTLEGVPIPPEIAAQQELSHECGNSLVMVAIDGGLAGAIELQPTLRTEAPEVISKLRARGLKLVIISGDQEEPTRRLAEALGMDRYFANILPEGKAGLIEELQREGHSVCFVGDGINDSIALKRSNISVSLRGATTVATDAAQIVLMQESLEKLPYLFTLGDDMENISRIGYAAAMIPGAIVIGGVFLFGWGVPTAMLVSMSGFTVGIASAMYPMYKHRQALAAQNASLPGAAKSLPEAQQEGSSSEVIELSTSPA